MLYLKVRSLLSLYLVGTATFIIWLMPACTIAGDKPVIDPSKITSFEECVKAGYPIMRSLPPRCAVPDGEVFTDTRKAIPHLADGRICRDQCGDGVCQEIVCMGEGCPCSENRSSCPKDCK